MVPATVCFFQGVNGAGRTQVWIQVNIVAAGLQILNQQLQHCHPVCQGRLVGFERIIGRPDCDQIKPLG